MQLTPVKDSTQVRIDTGDPNIGALRLWVPEAIASNTGVSAVYPVGTWVEHGIYFLYSNPNNPCTDIMLAFGHVAPGAVAQASGTVWIRADLAENVLE